MRKLVLLLAALALVPTTAAAFTDRTDKGNPTASPPTTLGSLVDDFLSVWEHGGNVSLPLYVQEKGTENRFFVQGITVYPEGRPIGAGDFELLVSQTVTDWSLWGVLQEIQSVIPSPHNAQDSDLIVQVRDQDSGAVFSKTMKVVSDGAGAWVLLVS